MNDLDFYSDYHKEAYGFRPTTRQWERVAAMSHDEFRAELAVLERAVERSIAEEAEAQARAVNALEAHIAELVKLGAETRDRAIAWLHDAYETRGDADYLCWHLGVPYGYIT
jgi:hypothetical protein